VTGGRFGAARLVEEVLDFEPFPADPVRFIPVDLCEASVTVLQLDEGNTLHLPPIQSAKRGTQARQRTNAPSLGNGFDAGDRADDGEVHRQPIVSWQRMRQFERRYAEA
jgi:hypothetical protein